MNEITHGEITNRIPDESLDRILTPGFNGYVSGANYIIMARELKERREHERHSRTGEQREKAALAVAQTLFGPDAKAHKVHYAVVDAVRKAMRP
jgi:hypothetical protein